MTNWRNIMRIYATHRSQTNEELVNPQEMPRLIPTQRFNGTTVSNRTSDEDDTGSNETLSEDPMNLVETSWDLSNSLHDNGSATSAASAASTSHKQATPPIMN